MSAYRHVDCHGAEQPDNYIETSQSTVSGVHVRAGELHVSGDQRPTTMCNNCSPEEQSEKSWRHNDCLDEEENSQLLDRHTGQYGLEGPIDEEAEKLSR
jgi:hypothetical protein